MPRIKLTKSAIDGLPTPQLDTVFWDTGCPGFGVKVTPKGRKVFVVLYRTGGAGSKLRKYTIGPYGRATLHQARVAAQQVFAAKLEGRDLASGRCPFRLRGRARLAAPGNARTPGSPYSSRRSGSRWTARYRLQCRARGRTGTEAGGPTAGVPHQCQ